MFRILVAEDDESTRLLMCEVLRQAGYEPCPAKDGVEALEVMEHYQCDLAVVDITMPRMDGIAFTQTLREGNCDLPVLVSAVKLEPSAAALWEGGNQQLTATVQPENAENKKIKWSSPFFFTHV